MGDFNKKQLQYHYRDNFIIFTRLFCDKKPGARGSQRDVVYLGWPIALSYVSDRLERKRQRGGGTGYHSALQSCVHGAQFNFDDLQYI